jgi:3-methyladenine DNA glycosylase AlkD
MTLEEAMAELEALGNEKVCRRASRQGAGDRQFGVQQGAIRKLAKKAKADHELALALWDTGNVDAQMMATLMLKPRKLSQDELDRLVRSVTCVQLADWINAYVVKKHPEHEALRERWMTDDDPMAARAGWNLTSIRIAKDPEGLDVPALLDRIESEMADADPFPQWTMNMALVEIGVHHPEHRERALAIGEALGVFRDYPVPKGCTSPFAPAWIGEMVRRQG